MCSKFNHLNDSITQSGKDHNLYVRHITKGRTVKKWPELFHFGCNETEQKEMTLKTFTPNYENSLQLKKTIIV